MKMTHWSQVTSIMGIVAAAGFAAANTAAGGGYHLPQWILVALTLVSGLSASPVPAAAPDAPATTTKGK